MADKADASATDSGGDARRSPYQQLEDALARLVSTGLLDPDRAGDAAITCWSGVHGFATLTSRGPLRELPRHLVDAHAERLVAELVDAVTRPERIGSSRPPAPVIRGNGVKDAVQ